MAGVVTSEHCSCFTIMGRGWARSMLLWSYTTWDSAMRLSQTFMFFVNTQPVCIGLLHRPSFRKLGCKSWSMLWCHYSTCWQCCDATIAINVVQLSLAGHVAPINPYGIMMNSLEPIAWPKAEYCLLYGCLTHVKLKKRLSVTNFSSENNLLMFRLNAPVIIREKMKRCEQCYYL